MLQIKNIYKQYQTGSLIQKALDGVSLNLRDNEFVAILGPSGSGKTTLLNIIGGLDRYDQGDLIINGISTKKYRDRDWDSYRNHTIGFVFQSYNLIPHQTVLANVELALTISGISKAERREKARKALEEVGLGNQGHKKPNQMSGGQMHRIPLSLPAVSGRTRLSPLSFCSTPHPFPPFSRGRTRPFLRFSGGRLPRSLLLAFCSSPLFPVSVFSLSPVPQTQGR